MGDDGRGRGTRFVAVDLDDATDHLPGGQRRCTAQRTDRSGRCKKPARRGAWVCSHHGGSAPAVIDAARRRLAEASDRAAQVLVDLAVDPSQPGAVRRAAAADVLDRTGVVRVTSVEVVEHDAAKARLVDAIARLRAARDGGAVPSSRPLPVSREHAPALASALAKFRAVAPPGTHDRPDRAEPDADRHDRDDRHPSLDDLDAADLAEWIDRATHRALPAPRPEPPVPWE